MRAAVNGLYAITPELGDLELLLEKTGAALRGGVRLVQYRSKTTDHAARRDQACSLVALCRQSGARLIVNDDVALAVECGADGVHLGRDDGEVAAARLLLGPGRLVGVSCYGELQRARHAQAAGADYVAFGSFFPSSTKPGAVRVGTGLLRAARAEVALPIVAIGGITVDNAGALIAAGADAVAVVSALFDAHDVETEARRFAGLFAPS